jgi:hypothetical protein
MPEPDPHPPLFAPGERDDAPLLPRAATAEGWRAQRLIDDTEASLAVHLHGRTRNQNDWMLASKDGTAHGRAKREDRRGAAPPSPISRSRRDATWQLLRTAPLRVSSRTPR